jgi:hypothetical protein
MNTIQDDLREAGVPIPTPPSQAAGDSPCDRCRPACDCDPEEHPGGPCRGQIWVYHTLSGLWSPMCVSHAADCEANEMFYVPAWRAT